MSEAIPAFLMLEERVFFRPITSSKGTASLPDLKQEVDYARIKSFQSQ
jgi:hypothetical protein